MFNLKAVKTILKTTLFSFTALAIVLGAQGLFVSANVHAADDGAGAACQALKDFDPTIDCSTGGTANEVAAKPLTAAINLLTYIVGAISIIMVIYGGFKFITSGGDSDATKKARTTVLYALIGLALVIMAQVIVRLAFSTAKDIS